MLLSLVALLALSAPGALGAGLIVVEDTSWRSGPTPPPPRWPRPFPLPRPHPFSALDVNYVKVHTRITDQVAVTSVDQEFYNPHSARLEGTFIFPVPKGAHLDKFRMEINGQSTEAELLPADKARRMYEDIVRKLKDPALLEYAGRDIFKVRIFPIEPNSRKRITVSYTELLTIDNGLVNYRLPLSTEKYSAKPIHAVSVKVDLETKRPLKAIYSPSHSVEVKRQGSNRATAGYQGKEVQPDTDFALYFAPEKDDVGLNVLSHCVRGEDGYFLLLASPGVEVKESQVVKKDVALVLDTSGSMAGKKLEQAKKALQFCVENLNDGDRFEVIRFSTEVEALFDQLAPASSANRAKAEGFLKDLRPIGGTAIDDALRRAIALGRAREHEQRPFVIIFLTDGRPTIGTTEEDAIVGNVKAEAGGQARIFCFGIGIDVNTHLLDRITEETRAVSQYVLPEEDLEVKVSNFFSKIKEPVLANPTLRITGDVRLTKLYPSSLPDLFKGEQLVLVGRYSGKGDAVVVVEGAVNGTARKFTYETALPGENPANEFIPRLWATRRVGYLLDAIRLHGENAELRDEVTELARKYSIVTPYTAYLILEDESQRNVPMPMRSLQGLDRDAGVRREAAQAWRELREERSGDRAVAGARYGMLFKSADALAAPGANSTAEARRSLGLADTVGGAAAASPVNRSKERLVQSMQQSQFVAGKSFFQNDQQWIDSAIQQHPDAKRLRIQFGSTEYFDLVAKQPQALPWLALGRNVHFLLGDTIYAIYE